MKQTTPTIILTGGGSGGHITPLLSLAHELKVQQPHTRVVFIGYKGDNLTQTHDFDKVFLINAGKFRRYHDENLWQRLIDFKTIILNTRDFFRFIGSIGSAYRILGKSKPDVVFSKGGFVSVPVGLAARLRRVPIVTHDSDSVGGLANRIVGRWAGVRTSGSPDESGGAQYIGIPLSANIKYASVAEQEKFKGQLGVRMDEPLLLLTGGGNGSAHLNELLVSAAPSLLRSYPNLHITHIAGVKHIKQVQDAYKASLSAEELKRLNVLGFIDDLYKYSAAADLIISRAGATAIAEFAAQGKACIIIPSQFLAAGHQMGNAKVLEEADAAIIVDEAADADKLVDALKSLLADKNRREHLAKNLHSLAKTDASEALAKIILQVASQ